MFGDGTQSRCFTYVRDAVRAILSLTDCADAVGELFNVGSSKEITINKLADRILEIVESEGGPRKEEGRTVLIPYEDVYNSEFEDMSRRVPNTRKIQALTGWAPRLALERILTDSLEQMCSGSEFRERIGTP